MTYNEPQGESTSTPDRAQEVTYKPLGEQVEGTTHVDTPTAAEVHEASADSEHYVESPKVADTEDALWDKNRPPFILSFVDTEHPNGGFVIGWDTCGLCNYHIRTCTCKNGPSQPAYVKRWRRSDDEKHDKASVPSGAVKRAMVVADPQVVEKAVDQAFHEEAPDDNDERHPSGRKRRADAGMPRGPRAKGTPESVLEAAGDLSAAMSKE